jgi:hypothetical protein
MYLKSSCIKNTEAKEVVIVMDDAEKIVFAKDVSDSIQHTWTQLIAKNPDLYEAGLVRCASVDTDSSHVYVHTALDITYKDVVGLRNAPIFQTLHTVPFQALSAIALVHTADGHCLLVERKTGDWPHSLELPGAFVRPKVHDSGVYESLLDFLYSDLKVTKEHIQTYSLQGVIDYASICETMMVFRFQIQLTFKEVSLQASRNVYMLPRGYTTQEHNSFFTLPLHNPSKTVLEQYLLD